jgi:hypothetical protein
MNIICSLLSDNDIKFYRGYKDNLKVLFWLKYQCRNSGRRTFSVFEKFKQIQVAVDADRNGIEQLLLQPKSQSDYSMTLSAPKGEGRILYFTDFYGDLYSDDWILHHWKFT